MKTYKITIAYDGTKYFGWQYQPEEITVTSVLQDYFKRIFSRDIKILASSRTDAGVHALGQVARFSVDLAISTQKMKWAWNNALPEDIIIRDLQEVEGSFHPLYNVVQKTYYYHFFLKKPLPFAAPYGWYFTKKIDLDKLRECLQIFVGTHDFRSYSCDEKENTVRTIDSIELRFVRRYGCYQIIVRGKGFLRHMIRRIVGASFLIASSKNRFPLELQQALVNVDSEQTLFTAPAHGLLLRKIKYCK